MKDRMNLTVEATSDLSDEAIDARREAVARVTSQKHKSAFGQFMTPSVIATFMASMFHPLAEKTVRLLDAGAGIGSLTVALAKRAAAEHASSLECTAWEIDDLLHEQLSTTLDACGDLMRATGAQYSSTIKSTDFILSFSDELTSRGETLGPTHAILNPPYKKISSASAHRKALRVLGVETANLYSGFVALALKSLADGGEMVAITPRSFCNGPYFRPFRELLLTTSAITRIHVFESRTHAFKGDEVLQENVIFHLVKGRRQGPVVISSSQDATFSEVRERTTPFDNVVLPEDREQIFHLATEDEGTETGKAMARYHFTLEELGLGVSTGPVVDFRMRDHLRVAPGPGTAPMIHSHHFESGFVVHPKLDVKKPNYIEVNDDTRKWMMSTGCYVVVRRLSSKEEKRRIVPAVFTPVAAPGSLVGFDNKTNIVHQSKQGMEDTLAKGMAVYLASTFADRWLRRFSGHTQVNAGDLRALRYPNAATLHAWGKEVGTALPSQEQIDKFVGGVDG
ncbi:Eco57I restriction-modification methylase domain-containing protein [Massilia aquatica]|uniref:site-specific DNA-methyltransferase (adenine-specific) n=1 Tax=Massilia aquatica TaxID=2609000 RepID=A0ABX0M2W7_9BURK|nr:Eco57I restriction-modification methylase domain-containing protein [Massilia aquatica]NHZ38657.1 SAM-dependent methyltransferase [Massilia aquatica]